MLWRQGVQTIGLFNHKLKSALKCTVYDHNARPSQTDRRKDKRTDGQTDRRTNEHHSNSAMIRSNERIAR